MLFFLFLVLFVVTGTPAKDTDPIDSQIKQLKVLKEYLATELEVYATKEGLKDLDLSEVCREWKERIYRIVEKGGLAIDPDGWIEVEEGKYLKIDESCRVHEKEIDISVPVDTHTVEEIKRKVETEPVPSKPDKAVSYSPYQLIGLVLLTITSVVFLKGIVESLVARRGVEAFIRFIMFLIVSGVAYSFLSLL